MQTRFHLVFTRRVDVQNIAMRPHRTNRPPGGPEVAPRGGQRFFRVGRQFASETHEVNLAGTRASIDLRFVELNEFCVIAASRPMSKSCEECERLLGQVFGAIDQWRELLKTLSDSALSKEIDLFVSAWARADGAKNGVAAARASYYRHLAAHRPAC